MATWIKQGVFGNLTSGAAYGLRRVEKLFHLKNEDLFVTCIREGTHMPGSLHPSGDAFDIRKPMTFDLDHLKAVLGDDFDVVEEKTHIHIEYDPPKE